MRRTAVSMLAGVVLLAGTGGVRPAVADSAWLGVYSQQITPELREGLNYNGAGALVTRIVSDSPAARAGIQRGDVIVRVGSTDVDSPDRLASAVSSSAPGKAVDLTVVRDGKKRSMRVTLASRDESGDRGDFDTPAPPEPPRMGQPEPDDVDAPDAPDTPREPIEWHGDDDIMVHLPDVMGPGMMGRGRLGVRIESLNPDLASYFGSRDAKGALVLDVTDGSPADKAGIRAGDVITGLGGKSIEGGDDLIEAVRSGEGPVSISLLRHGAKQTVKADLGKAPKIMRFRSNPRGYGWKSKDGNSWMFRSPGADGRMKRIVIDGDDNGSQADRESMDQLRDQIQQLREQLDQLREELKSKSNR